MPNHSVLTLNILHGLRGASDNEDIYEEAESIYFRFLDLKERPLAAEAKALMWIKVYFILFKVFNAPGFREMYSSFGPEGLSPEVEKDLVRFIRKRYEVYIQKEKT